MILQRWFEWISRYILGSLKMDFFEWDNHNNHYQQEKNANSCVKWKKAFVYTELNP